MEGLTCKGLEVQCGCHLDSEVTAELLAAAKDEVMRDINRSIMDWHYQSIHRGYKKDYPNLPCLPEHRDAMDGQTDDVWEVEADCRSLSMELQEDDAEQEQLTALWDDEPPESMGQLKSWNGRHRIGG